MDDPEPPLAPTAEIQALVDEEQARIAAELVGLAGDTDPFVSAVRATRMPMIITNPRLPDNPVVFANGAFCRLSGYSRDEIVGRNCRFLQGPETDRETVARIAAAVRAVRPIEIDIRNYRKNGSEFWNRLLMAPVRDAAGQLAYFFASQVDVTIERERLTSLENSNAALMAELTDRLRMQEADAAKLRIATDEARRAQAELLTKAAEFEALAENVSQLAWMAEPNGDIVWYNQRWYSYTGTTFEAVKGWGWRSVHRPDQIEHVVSDVRERWAAGLAWDSVFYLRSAIGEYRPFLTQVRPIRNEAGELLRWFGTNTDITAQLEAEHRLRELNDTLEQRVATEVAERSKAEGQLRQSQKMEAVGQLTGGLAHDFNNLLAGIAGSLELLQLRIGQGRSDDVERYITAARGATERAAALTHRLLAFSRRQTLEPKPTDLNTLVVGFEDLIRRSIGPSVTLDIVPGEDLWTTLVDPSQLENALLNLCINARDAMPDGGRVAVQTANAALDARSARSYDVVPGDYVSMSVTDTGTGMTPEVIAQAFDPFFTTKPLGQGTGLGLSMIYGFVKQSGGQVRIHSIVGTGTTVRLLLPRHKGEAASATRANELPTGLGTRPGGRVLVVDDEPTVRMLVLDVLEEIGCTALAASDGVAGLAVLNEGVDVDLLITDVGLPGRLNGRQLADAARAARPDLKVLFITGYAESAVLNHGHLESGMHIVTKPFSLEVLSTKIQRLLAYA